MKSFDEFIERYRKDNKCSPLKSKCFEAGAQSRQAEIDKLQKDNEGYRKLVNYDTQEMEKLHNKIDELKKRIDDALHTADESCGVSVAAFVKLNKILKGNQS